MSAQPKVVVKIESEEDMLALQVSIESIDRGILCYIS